MKRLNLAQVAQKLQIDAKEAEILLKSGMIKGRRSDGDWEVMEEDVQDYLREEQKKPDPGSGPEKRENIPND